MERVRKANTRRASSAGAGPIDIFEVSLATARFAGENLEEPFAEYLRSLFENHKLDLAVTVGAPAANFFHKHRSKISPATPVVFVGLEQRRLPQPLAPNEAAVASVLDFSGSLENILSVLPETKNVAVVIGNSPLEQYWLGQVRDAFQPFGNRVAFTWFNELSLEDMLVRSARLPPKSVIFFVVLSVDAAGVTHEEGNAVDRLHAVANAPVFSWNDIYLGRGIVGGSLTPAGETGRKAASAAVQILNGKAASEIPIQTVRYGTPRFDWRELQRWGISEASLPAGSAIEFRVPTIFEQYKWTIGAAVALLLFQAAIITALLLNRRRLVRERVVRQTAEMAARDFSERLISVQEDERSRLARELHDEKLKEAGGERGLGEEIRQRLQVTFNAGERDPLTDLLLKLFERSARNLSPDEEWWANRFASDAFKVAVNKLLNEVPPAHPKNEAPSATKAKFQTKYGPDATPEIIGEEVARAVLVENATEQLRRHTGN